MRKLPCRLLRDVQIPMQLHAGYRLERSRDQVYSNNPRLITQLRFVKRGADLHAEPLPASVALASPRTTPVLVGANVERPAMRAPGFIPPTLFLEPKPGGLIVREQLEQRGDGYPFPVVLAGCACHFRYPRIELTWVDYPINWPSDI